MSTKQNGSRNTPIEVERVNTKVEDEPYAGTGHILTSSEATDSHGTEQADNTKGRGEFDARIEKTLCGFGRPYDCATEQEPSLAAYHPSFRSAEKSCNDIYERAANLLESSDYKDDETRQLLADIENIGGVIYSTLSRVGLIGDSGVGQCSRVRRIESCLLTIDRKELSRQLLAAQSESCPRGN